MNLVFRSFSRKMHSPTQSKFRGCLLGSLMGDCLGAPYEGQEITSGDKIIIQRYFDKMEDPSFKGPFKKYTDDTAMMRSVANFLLDKPDGDMKHLARLFVNEFFKQPGRGYGQNVVEVFEKLKDTKYKDVFKPATEQFNGSGSYGNGGAMRMAPIPLFFNDNFDAMLKVAEESTKITHTNLLGINGALLQCLAIHQAFQADSSRPVDVQSFCAELLKKIKKIEDNAYEVEDQSETPFCSKLKQMQSLLKKKPSDDLDEEVIYILGNGISAYESVATAIYCFLRAQTDIPGIQTSDQLRRTLQYAITLGGDTDTIACMAGAIVGAHLGEGAINKNLLQHCEKHQQIEELADKLFEATSGV
ncbi:ADP-ribosylhydrolase ARH3 isoform X1 [Dendroctonus ponderosae]|uniref:ADP-ribosylhydrolase ARH3 n=1 Tax=Dendroctonus ponderosae TaxID=77166 RepID=J3JYB8_DENPD|nr:ADP-ribosylhydrolase ARH3 isoform X1 [Dendroctonus ponderosae]AEE63204.1 unknown [Dendroctonus ponderosae]